MFKGSSTQVLEFLGQTKEVKNRKIDIFQFITRLTLSQGVRYAARRQGLST